MKITYNVIQKVEVELDETKITKEFMEEFSSYMWHVEDIKEIGSHIAFNKAIFDGWAVEGVPDDFYKAKIVEQGVEIDI